MKVGDEVVLLSLKGLFSVAAVRVRRIRGYQWDSEDEDEDSWKG